VGLFDGKVERPLKRSARFTEDSRGRKHRLVLERYLDPNGALSGPRVLFVMLNPSIADATVDDPTVRQCSWFAEHRFAAGVFAVCNLFTLCATDPRELHDAAKAGHEVNVPLSHSVLDEELRKADRTVAAWGAHAARYPERHRDVFALMRARFKPGQIGVEALALTQGGQPSHPLMLPHSSKPFAIRPVVHPNAPNAHRYEAAA
jgi:hypothetical protein